MATFEEALDAASRTVTPISPDYAAVIVYRDFPDWVFRHENVGIETLLFNQQTLVSTNMTDAIAEVETYLTGTVGAVKVTGWSSPVTDLFQACAVWVKLPS
jgi:hypothetical protein